MKLVDFYPSLGSFRRGESVQLIFELTAEEPGQASIHLSITHLAEPAAEFDIPISVRPGSQEISFDWQPSEDSPRGFGASAYLARLPTERGETMWTAFDVLDNWTDYPRYGFLCDFGPDRKDIEQVLDKLLKYHINGLQFYDWQYRHDQLFPSQPEYSDPLGRPSSLGTIEAFIGAAHQRHMAAMPYLAIYAASKDFAQSHASWALYNEKGSPYFFEDFLGLMDPSAGSPWSLHLLDQCRQITEKLRFDGFHVDQYGEPRSGFTSSGSSVNLPDAFVGFVNALKARHPDEAVTFNAVKNWPIESLARASLDFLYIELWPSTPSYRDVVRVISEARSKSGGKPVVIAIYLPADRPNNIRLADALILSSGATRIELGENERLLADAYFPKHEAVGDDLRRTLRAYCDFAVRYGELIGPRAEDLASLEPILPDGIWSVSRRTDRRIAINLVNMRGLGDAGWGEQHPSPDPLKEFMVRVPLREGIRQVHYASPDGSDPSMIPASWRSDGQSVEIEIPQLEFWSLILIETISG